MAYTLEQLDKLEKLICDGHQVASAVVLDLIAQVRRESQHAADVSDSWLEADTRAKHVEQASVWQAWTSVLMLAVAYDIGRFDGKSEKPAGHWPACPYPWVPTVAKQQNCTCEACRPGKAGT